MRLLQESEDICVKELDWRGDSSGDPLNHLALALAANLILVKSTAFVGDGTGGFDYIMAADVIGFPAVLDILATTLHTLMFSPCVTVVHPSPTSRGESLTWRFTHRERLNVSCRSRCGMPGSKRASWIKCERRGSV